MSAMLTFFLISIGAFIGVLDTGSDATSTGDDDEETGDPGLEVTGEDGTDDDLIGSTFNDIISGLDGADTLSGLQGDDTLDGGAGDDEASGGLGNDVLLGGAGSDDLNGNAGNDTLNGGDGDDTVDGGVDDDSLVGGAGADELRGSSGNDTLVGGTTEIPNDESADTLIAGDGDDVLFLSGGDLGTGGAGADAFTLVEGETGASTITDFDPATDMLVIQEGEFDVAVASQVVTAEGVLVTFDSGATVLVQGLTEPLSDDVITIVDGSEDPADPVEDTVDPGEDTVEAEVILVTGTDGADTVSPPGDGQALSADLGAGDDAATGAAENDTIIGGVGADTISGAAGNDILFSTSGNATAASDGDVDSVSGGLGDDTLVLGTGDIATGGDGADVFALRPDVNDTVTVADFDPAGDLLVVETAMPGDASILGQTSTPDGLVISFSTMGSVLLTGVTDPIDPNLVRFEAPGLSTSA